MNLDLSSKCLISLNYKSDTGQAQIPYFSRRTDVCCFFQHANYVRDQDDAKKAGGILSTGRCREHGKQY